MTVDLLVISEAVLAREKVELTDIIEEEVADGHTADSEALRRRPYGEAP